jgi:hypothetical protein
MDFLILMKRLPNSKTKSRILGEKPISDPFRAEKSTENPEARK